MKGATKEKRIVLIIAGQPSTNPRTVKEYMALKNAGYHVKVLYAYWTEWAVESDQHLFRDYGIDKTDFILIGGSPHEQKWTYFLSRALHKISRSLGRRWPLFSEWAESRVALFAQRKALSIKADLLIAHSLGMIPAAVLSAKKQNAKAAVDFEDCFSGQWRKGSPEYRRSIQIEEKYLQEIDFCTAASPLIAEKYADRFGLSPYVVNNVFSLKNLQAPVEKESGTLKLFWFSQTVGKYRGLEETIQAMGICHSSNLQLTIMGDCSAEMHGFLLSMAAKNGVAKSQLIFIPPQPLDEIFRIANQHDIGLATEIGFSENNNICLSNKLFTYLLSGLAIIATKTPAQEQFFSQHPDVGYTFDVKNSKSLVKLLEKLLSDLPLLNSCKRASYDLAKNKFNWELEAKGFTSFIESNLM